MHPLYVFREPTKTLQTEFCLYRAALASPLAKYLPASIKQSNLYFSSPVSLSRPITARETGLFMPTRFLPRT